MGRVTGKVILNLKRESVWRFITDPKNFSQYVHGYAYGKVISQNKLGIGARYEWYGKLGPFQLQSTEEIVRWEEPRLVVYKGRLFGISFDSSMEVQEMEDNKAMLTITIQYKVPVFFGGNVMDIVLVKGIVDSSVRESIKKLEGIFNQK